MNRFARFWLLFFALLTATVACRKDTGSHGSPPSIVAASYSPPSITQITQASWFVNPTSGSDLADCATSGTACKTFAEIHRRWQCGMIMQATSVFVLASLPLTDPINVCENLYGGNLSFFGGPTNVIGSGSTNIQSGTLSSCTSTTPASNIQGNCVDVALSSWTSVLNQRIRITAGARSGQWAWVGKDLGGGAGAAAARFSGFGTAVTTSPNSAQNGDTYQIDGQIIAPLGAITPTCGGLSNLHVLVLQDFEFSNSGAGFSAVLGPSSCALTIVGSNFSLLGSFGVAAPYFFNNTFENTQVGAITMRGPEVQFIGGLLGNNGGTAAAVLSQAGIFSLRGGTLIENTQGIQVNGPAFVTVIDNTDQIGIFDTVSNVNSNPNGSAIILGAGSQNAGITGSFGVTAINAAVYGSGNAGVGLEIQRGATASVTGTSITVTGTLGDFRLATNGSSQAYPFINSSNVYGAAPIAQTWTNFNASIVGGGFGGNAHNLQDNSHLVTYHFVPPLALLALRRRKRKPANDNDRAFDSKRRAA